MMYWVISLCVLLILLIAGVYMMGVQSQRPKRKPITDTPVIPYEDVQWHSQGSEIRGWFIPAKKELQEKKTPLLIIAHGWGSNRVSMLRYVSVLHAEGYALLLYDARSHGESAGIPATSGLSMRDDLLSALDYAETRNEIDPRRIGVLGHSLGAFASALALAHADHRIRAVVTDAMPARTQTMMQSELRKHRIPQFPLVHILPWIWYLRSHATPRDIDVIEAITGCDTPLLMTHSHGDHVIPITEMEYIRSRAHRTTINYLHLNGEGHSSSAMQPKFWGHVLPFLRKYLQE